MTPLQTRMARIYAHELADALSAQLTMHMTGVVANFPAAEIAVESANDALENVAKAMGFKLVALDSVREGSDYQMEAAQ